MGIDLPQGGWELAVVMSRSGSRLKLRSRSRERSRLWKEAEQIRSGQVKSKFRQLQQDGLMQTREYKRVNETRNQVVENGR